MSTSLRGKEALFWNKVDKSGGAEACWPWTSGISSRYGYFTFSIAGKAYARRAHRYSYTITFGDIPEGLCVCHRCDNPICVNPQHLFLGTTKDNVADKIAKGRQQRGVICSVQAKLTTATAQEIRELYASGLYTQAELGRRYGVNPSTISNCVRGKHRHFPEVLEGGCANPI